MLFNDRGKVQKGVFNLILTFTDSVAREFHAAEVHGLNPGSIDSGFVWCGEKTIIHALWGRRGGGGGKGGGGIGAGCFMEQVPG